MVAYREGTKLSNGPCVSGVRMEIHFEGWISDVTRNLDDLRLFLTKVWVCFRSLPCFLFLLSIVAVEDVITNPLQILHHHSGQSTQHTS